MLSPEPILDVVRGISTVASFGIIANQMWVLLNEIFTGECEYCRGTGRVICRHCQGSKSLRKRPGEFYITRMQVADRSSADVYPCIYCGPFTKYDMEKVNEDNEDEAYNIMDNFKAAIANKRVPYPQPIWAGTIPCPECEGSPMIYRHTPNWARIMDMEQPFHVRAAERMGVWTRAGGSRQRPRKFLEYPSRMPKDLRLDADHAAEVLAAKVHAELSKERKKEGPTMKARDQLTADDYIIPYVDDEDSDVEN